MIANASTRGFSGLALFTIVPGLAAAWAGWSVAPAAAVVGGAVGALTGYVVWSQWSPSVIAGVAPRRPTTFYVAALLLVGIMAVSVVPSAIDRFLSAIHKPGDASYGLRILSGVFLDAPATLVSISDALKVWSQADPGGGLPRTEVARGLLLLNGALASFLLIPLTALFWTRVVGQVIGWLSHNASQLDARSTHGTQLWGNQSPGVAPTAPERYVHWAKLTLLATIMTAAVAWVHQATGLQLTLGQPSPELLPGVLLIASDAVRNGGTLVVWGFLVGMGLVWLNVRMRPQFGEQAATLLGALRAVRIPLLALAVFGIALSVGNEIPDDLRRWATDAIGPPAIGLLATLLFGTVAGAASWCALIPGAPRTPPSSPIWPLGAAVVLYVNLWIALWTASAGALHWYVGLLLLISVGLLTAAAGHPAFRGWKARLGIGVVALALSIVAAVLAVIGGTAALEAQTLSWKPILPFGIALVLFLIGLPFASWQGRTGQGQPLPGATSWPWLIAGAPLVLLGLALGGQAADLAFFGWAQLDNPASAQAVRLVVYTLLAIAFGLGAMTLANWLIRGAWIQALARRARARALVGLWVSLLVGLVLWIAIVALLGANADFLLVATQQMGVLGLAAIAFSLVIVIGMSLVGLADALFPTPRVYRLLGYSHTPVVSLVLLWWLLASALPPEEATHDARRVVTAPSAAETTLERLDRDFDTFVDRQCPLGVGGLSKPVVPLVLVATAGGGARAATWTTYVLDNVLGYQAPPQDACAERPSSRVFAMSGVSGGSVGLSTYSSRVAANDTGRIPVPNQDLEGTGQGERGWIRSQLGISTLAPNVAWMLFSETPWSVLRYPLQQDRAAVLERTWERFWWQELPEPPKLFEMHRQAPNIPLLVLNGTAAESGCRINVSVLRLSAQQPGDATQRCLAAPDAGEAVGAYLGTTIDVGDFLCSNQDVWLSTAALLSARWPYISPSGRVLQCDRGLRSAATVTDATIRTYAVDGGYHEGSGAATALDLWQAIEPLVTLHNTNPRATSYVVPFAIQIDNGYSQPAGPGAAPAQPQFAVPILTIIAANGAASERTRQALELVFDKRYAVPGTDKAFCGRYVHFDLQPHPGPEATVGWTLSDVSFDDMTRQIRNQKPKAETVQEWGQDLAKSLC